MRALRWLLVGGLAALSVAIPAHAQQPPAFAPYPLSCTFGVAVSESSGGYQPGWNLIASPSGMAPAGVVGPLYTWQAGDTDYEQVSADQPLDPSAGYWAYFTNAVILRPVPGPEPAKGATVTVQLPAGQWTLVGNPFPRIADLSGDDVAYRYTPGSGYSVPKFLHPGEAAWVFSWGGGPLVLTNIAQCSG